MKVTQGVAIALLAAGLAPSLCAAQQKRVASKPARPARPAPAATARAKSAPVRRAAPPLSYLNENSYSLNAVINQIRGNRKLLLRYANHFHIPPEQVIPYFRQNLVESYIPKTGRYQVWMKRPDGSTYSRYQTFHAGERVLALKNGQPVLKWACGNPLITQLPTIEKRKVVERTKQVLPNIQKRTRYYNVETPFETPTKLAALPPVYDAPSSAMSHLVTREVVPSASRRFPAAALLPFMFHNPPDVPKIPEPATVTLALVGAAGAGLFARKRK